jgi:hypothetical protein
MSKSRKSVNHSKLYSELLNAYLRFKSYIYYENFSVCLKNDLAIFEREHKVRLTKLALELDRVQQTGKSRYIDSLIKSINYYLMPKKFKEEEYDFSEGTFISNKNKYKHYEIDNLNKLIPFFNAPIELHIISTLWVLKIGILFDKNLPYSTFANRLYKADVLKKDRLKLFKKYFNRYNAWRDSAIDAAKKSHWLGNDVAILNLDIRSYYHSINFDLSSLRITKSLQWLNKILISIHNHYVDKLIKDDILEKPAKKILPIGLVSSSILANYYLKQFDLNVQQYVKPLFYGRYVDDFLIVFKNPIINESSTNVVSDFIDKNILLKKPSIATEFIRKTRSNDYEILINGDHLSFQLSKVKLYYFKSSDSTDLLDEFKKEIEKNTSEFKVQLEEEELKNPFEDSIYKITYSDTINKLRSIDGFTPNKFGASKQLAKIINATKYLNGESNGVISEISTKVNDYFIGKRALQLFQLWEKSFAYFVINNDSIGLIKFSSQLIDSISKVKVSIPGLSKRRNEELTNSLYEALLGYLKNGYSTAAALDINFFDTSIVGKIKRHSKRKIIVKILKRISVADIKRHATAIIESNLFNHAFASYPLLNYCKQPHNYSFSEKVIKATTNFEFDEQKVVLSPRHINFDEVELFNFLKFNFSRNSISEEYIKSKTSYNTKTFLAINSIKLLRKAKLFDSYQFVKDDHFNRIKIIAGKKHDKIRIGLANIKLSKADISSSISASPNLSLLKLNKINKALNEAIKNGAKIIVFPEVSIPLQWISKLAFYARKNDIAIICGVEHFSNKKEAFNYVCTILPFEENYIKYAHVDFRLKIDYSPSELEALKKANLDAPDTSYEKLRLVEWKGVFFTVFNCFELSDIEKRSLFRGKIDIAFAVEYNPDTIYFSNINESYSRDIHAYVIQVNSSDFGDTRITLPKKSEQRDYIKVKGGENISLVIGELDIKSLRNFQKLNHTDQKEDDSFKLTPPNFKMAKERV